ncbi:hypothetical protein ICJ04_08000 [Stenotrophomonas sp. 169]|uniref:hypothetical protein n=1 Tax=Stenotrophomonas sp. 169 TaxID=2770322 RepID=UPI001662364E|nr:hypothetical protein [Stenotrophomonas sp. 169]QNR98810.1 hypothetical protein ICJ04_08000 [Stenotrophomonas sp. 169]
MVDVDQILDRHLRLSEDVYVGAEVDPDAYLKDLSREIVSNRRDPFPLTAIVMAPGLPGFELGSAISGLCIAELDGKWLVYRPENDQFYAFWGIDKEMLGAHGVWGSPLYCWSA